MTKKFRIIFFLLLFSGFSVLAFAHPKKIPGVNDKTGTGVGDVEDGSEVKLPIGLPFSINDASGSSGISSDENGNDQPSKIVYTFDLPDGQGPQSFHETHSAFQQARNMNAACVLIRMNSMSGALDAADNLSNEIMDYDRPVMVYVNDKAIPASTLISMAADNKKNASNAKENKRSFAHKNKTTSSSANKTNSARVPRDERGCTEMSSVLPIGKQFTTGQNGDLDDVLTQAGLNNYTVVRYSPGFFAQVIDWCMKPYMSLLFVILIALGLRLQINSVFPGPATFLLLVSLPLFGVPLFVGGLAGAGEFGLALFFATLVIIAARKKVPSNVLKIVASMLCVITLTLCQSESISLQSNWQAPLISLVITSFAFAAGWLLPSFIGKFSRVRSTEIPATA